MGVSYNAKVATNGLVLCLDAGNKKSYVGSGTAWSDLSKQRNNAVLSGGATFDSSNNGSLAFDFINGVADVIDSDSLSFTNNIFTIDLWVYFNAVNVTQGVIGKRNWEYAIWAVNSTLSFTTWNVAGGTVYSNSATIQAGLWYNFIWVADGSQSTLYTNGVPGTTFTKTIETMGNTTTGLTLGRGGGAAAGNAYMNGKIASAKFYNIALTSPQIIGNFNALRGRFNI